MITTAQETLNKLNTRKLELVKQGEATLRTHGSASSDYKAITTELDAVSEHISLLQQTTANLPSEERTRPVPIAPPVNVVTPEQRVALSNAAFKRFFVTDGFERRDLTSDPSSGGVFVAQETHPVLFEVQKHFYPALSQLTVIERKNGSPLQLVSEDSTSLFLKAGAQAATPAESDLTTADSILDFDVLTASTKASKQLFSDSAFDLTSVITKSGGKQLAYTLDASIFAGTDAGGNALAHQANLLSTVAFGTTTSTLANGIGESDLASLVESVDNIYWPDASFVMNASTYLTLLQQKDGSGRRFWKELGDNPPHLWQWPVFISSSIPSIGASTTPILFGAFKNVALAYQGLALTILRERFADQNLLGYQLYTRTASQLMVANSIRSLKLAAA